MSNLITTKKIIFHLPFAEEDIISIFDEIYYSTAESNAYMRKNFPSTYVQDDLPSLDDFFESEDLTNMLASFVSLDHYGDERFYITLDHGERPDLVEEFDDLYHCLEVDMVRDVAEIVHAHNISFRMYNELVNYPIKGVW